MWYCVRGFRQIWWVPIRRVGMLDQFNFICALESIWWIWVGLGKCVRWINIQQFECRIVQRLWRGIGRRESLPAQRPNDNYANLSVRMSKSVLCLCEFLSVIHPKSRTAAIWSICLWFCHRLDQFDERWPAAVPKCQNCSLSALASDWEKGI